MTERPEVRPITPDHREDLSLFVCRRFKQPWTSAVEEMVRERLADALEVDPGLLAVGLWHGFTLCGVAAWRRPDADGVSFSPLVATRTGHSRRGYARILKEQVVKAARDAGAIVVVSTVHWDNEAMMQLNIDLGAWLDPIPGDDEYCRCIIPIGDPLPLPAALDDEPF